MRTIWKFVLDVTDGAFVAMPAGAELLSVQMQNGLACLWAKVDPDAPIKQRLIRCHGTGHTFSDVGYAFIGSIQLMNGALIFHFFDAGEAA